MKHGKGVEIFEDGSIYEGFYKNGYKDGVGRWISDTGELYLGGMKNEARHGFGINTFPNGDKYEGNFKNGLKSGSGVYFN